MQVINEWNRTWLSSGIWECLACIRKLCHEILVPKNKKCKETESIPTRKDLKLKSSFSVSVYPYVLCQIKDTAFGKDELKLYVI